MHLGGQPRRWTRPVAARPGKGAAGFGLGAIATLLVVGGFALTGVGAAAAATTPHTSTGSLVVSPNAGLIKGQQVAVVGTGLPTNSKGWLLECNMTPNEPTVRLGTPANITLVIGCSPPSLKQIASTDANGKLNIGFFILLGRKKVGPPCGPQIFVAVCPPDSRGQRALSDAQNYPCPPTPKQQVAGSKCDMVYIDQGGDIVQAPISFAGAGPPAVKGGGGSGGGGGGGGNKGPTTTLKPITTLAHITPTTVRIITAANTATTAPRSVASSQLAFTGAGPGVTTTFIVGAAMVFLGALLWLVALWRRPNPVRR